MRTSAGGATGACWAARNPASRPSRSRSSRPGKLSAQIGLGYSGRETLEAAAWHVPMGVTIFGLAVYQMTLIPRP
jgi:hypothetical protein